MLVLNRGKIMSGKRVLALGVVLTVIATVMFINTDFASAKNTAQQQTVVKKNQKTSADVFLTNGLVLSLVWGL